MSNLFFGIHSSFLWKVTDFIVFWSEDLPVQDKFTFVLLEHTHECAKRGGFSCTVTSEKAHGFAAFHFEGNIFKDFHIGKTLVYISDFKFHNCTPLAILDQFLIDTLLTIYTKAIIMSNGQTVEVKRFIRILCDCSKGSMYVMSIFRKDVKIPLNNDLRLVQGG